MEAKERGAAEKQESIEHLRELLSETAGELRDEGVPVRGDCRIDIEEFGDVFGKEEIERDGHLVLKREMQFYKRLSEDISKDLKGMEFETEEEKEALHQKLFLEEMKDEKLQEAGEQFEMLKTVVLNRALQGELLVARTSRFDDIEREADNIILDRKGNVLCAIDDVVDSFSRETEKKKENTMNINIKGREYEKNRFKEPGADLKYGVRLRGNKIEKGPLSHVPLFYLALPEHLLKSGIKELSRSEEERGDTEQLLFGWFCGSIKTQIMALNKERRLSPKLKSHLGAVEKILEKVLPEEEFEKILKAIEYPT